MHDITPDAVVIGVDTHKEVHVAVAINGLGVRLATASFPVTSEGYRQVAAWAAEHGVVHAFGIEGTGSYGAGLTRALTAMGLRVIEVGRVNRQLRRRHGKTDTVDAESAARAVLAGITARASISGCARAYSGRDRATARVFRGTVGD